MADSGELEVDMLFLGLTRPPLLFGVDYMIVSLNFLIHMSIFVIFTTFWIIFTILLVHGAAYLMSQREPRFIPLYFTRTSKCKNCKNYFYHGYNNSYDVV